MGGVFALESGEAKIPFDAVENPEHRKGINLIKWEIRSFGSSIYARSPIYVGERIINTYKFPNNEQKEYWLDVAVEALRIYGGRHNGHKENVIVTQISIVEDNGTRILFQNRRAK
jgi:hypothetical protein